MVGLNPLALSRPLPCPLADIPGGIAPMLSGTLVLVLCLVAGIATVLLLPNRRDAGIRKVGGAVLLATLLILGATLVRYAAGHAMRGPHFYFWIFSFVALVAAMRVITHPQPVYSALYFVLTVFATAGLFILLWAEFMAAALVLIYAGAILITYCFVIMLAQQSAVSGTTDKPATAVIEYDAVSREPVVAAAIGFALMGMLLFVILDKGATLTSAKASIGTFAYVARDEVSQERRGQFDAASMEEAKAKLATLKLTPDGPNGLVRQPLIGTTQDLGKELFRGHLVNLELAGLILTVSMIGAIVIARKQVLAAGAPTAAAPAGKPDVLSTPATPVDDNPHSIPVYGTDNPRQKAFPQT